MNRNSAKLGVLLAASLGPLAAGPAYAASLQQVSSWGKTSAMPSDITMYVAVPAKVATNPPILTLIHYCGGTAQAVFGQAKDLTAASDQYGFIIVAPSSGRCWDVTSSKTHTRDGGGDSHAIIQMVRYALTTYKGNADRVYSTGDSSGAMMTELLLALYPDVFKAGATNAGVPAGCSNEFDGSGLCGLSAQSAQQWGDRVRAMFPGYSGHRPRLQLIHGDADATITYKNMDEAIKEWTNVLALPTAPTTSVDTGLTLGTHQATRKSWQNACGYVVLDALTSKGGDHGPSDALFPGKYMISFLGLDVVGPTDPEIEKCGGGGTGSDGGTGGAGGSTGAGGSSGARDGGPDGRVAGNTAAGGTIASGGTVASGGGSGGSSGRGGASGSGGSASGGNTSSGGGTAGSSASSASGGTTGTGSSSALGGSSASGGSAGNGSSSASGSGGNSANPGSAGSGSTSPSSHGGTTGSSTSSGSKAGTGSSGCAYALGASSKKHPTVALALVVLAAFVGRRRRRS